MWHVTGIGGFAGTTRQYHYRFHVSLVPDTSSMLMFLFFKSRLMYESNFPHHDEFARPPGLFPMRNMIPCVVCVGCFVVVFSRFFAFCVCTPRGTEDHTVSRHRHGGGGLFRIYPFELCKLFRGCCLAWTRSRCRAYSKLYVMRDLEKVVIILRKILQSFREINVDLIETPPPLNLKSGRALSFSPTFLTFLVCILNQSTELGSVRKSLLVFCHNFF